jgi:hypothetical protein
VRWVGESKKKATRRVGLRVAAWFQLAGTSAGIGAAGCHLVGVGILDLELPLFLKAAPGNSPLVARLVRKPPVRGFPSATIMPQAHNFAHDYITHC